ncbi:RluA family pseudouridine synthase [Tissierella sp. Yu-01]|uniref:RluA family pseudouridine synthase n=1 Tax=Tissierella sp. Yu-01 TaxID=3035694 RepID=UPI00240DEF75|nr:RluA family pseudouridine synthase [Tissierella sp. Yu-01]WFA09825.1 RluA family pseudouridine synthase [Tissierella sp. Yu-01]
MGLIELYVDGESNERLDFYLSTELDEISRTYIQKLIKDKRVEVNGIKKKSSYLVKEGDHIYIDLPEPKKLELISENIPLDIVYEDEDVVVINKPQNMVVHPAPGNYTGTLVNALLYHVDSLSSINGIIRPGIVHRLDKDTSGLLVVAKNDATHRDLSSQLKERKVYREYLALVHGVIKEDTGIINEPIGRDPKNRKKMTVIYTNSKEAITNYWVINRYSKYTLVKVKLQTGRTHQIRVHFSHMKHPVVGDPVYSNGKNEFNLEKQLLHARKIGFIHPRTKEEMEFECDLPEPFTNIVEKLEKRG